MTIDREIDLSKVPHNTLKEINETRLIPYIGNVKSYKICYRMLFMLLSLGYKLKKLNFAISYEMSYSLKSFIDINVRLRRAALSTSDSLIYKLMNNSSKYNIYMILFSFIQYYPNRHAHAGTLRQTSSDRHTQIGSSKFPFFFSIWQNSIEKPI